VNRQDLDRPAQAGGQPSDSRLLGRNDDLLDLPVLEIHGRSPAQEADDGDELIVFPAPDHSSLDPGEGPGRDPDPGTHGSGRLWLHQLRKVGLDSSFAFELPVLGCGFPPADGVGPRF